MENIWTTLKPELIKQGFKIDDMFLQNISIKNKEYIKNLVYDLPTFIHELSNTMEDSENLIIKKCSPSGEEKKKVKMTSYINKGTYNQVYNVIDLESGYNYAYRFSNFRFTDDSNLVNNFIETFIHSFLSLYQKRYLLTNKTSLEENWGDSNILKLRHFGFNAKAGMISTITDKMDGTLYEVLSISGMILPQKINILVKALVQITCLIEHLQEKFKFIHNDLKANNIFYKILDKNKTDLYHPNNLHFFVSDFDASRIEIEGNIIIGNTHLSPDSTFNSRKDLFLLLHSLYYTFNSADWVFAFFGKFSLDSSIIGNQDKFHTLYQFNKDSISDFFEPSNFKAFMSTEYRATFDCWKQLGLNDDVVITVFGTKYKINYSSK
jgi:serine/threonine protein kinase